MMRARHVAARALHGAGLRLPDGLRARAGRASRRLRKGFDGPLVSVILAVSDEETTRIGPALDTLRAQTHRNLEIVVVGYGRCEQVLTTVRRHASEDWRVRLLPRTAADRAAARDRAVARSKGSYLQVTAGGDELLPDTIEDLLASVLRSGSPLAVGRISPPPIVGAYLTSPYDAAHRRRLLATTLDRTPIAITDLELGNRLFARDFWDSAGLSFLRHGGRDSDLALEAYRAAPRFDLLPEPGYVPTARKDGVAVGAVTDVLSRLDDWLAEQRGTADVVEAFGLPEVVDWWLWGVLDSALQPFLSDVERATPQQWQTLRTYAEEILGRTGEHAWSMLRAESRLKLWLVRHDRRDQLEELVVARWFERGDRPTSVEAGRVLAHLPGFDDPEIPRDVFEMVETETPLRVVVRAVRAGADVEVDLFAYAEYVGYDAVPEIVVRLVSGDAAVELPTTPYVDPDVNQVVGHRYQDYSAGLVTAHIDPVALATSSQVGQEWRIEVTLRYAGLVRTGGVTARELRSTAGMLHTGHLAPRPVTTPDGVRLVGFTSTGDDDLSLLVGERPAVRLREASVTGRTLVGSLEADDLTLTGVRLVSPAGDAARAPLSGGTDALTFSLDVPAPWPGVVLPLWSLVATAADGTEHAVGWPEAVADQWCATGSAVIPFRNGRGHVDVVEGGGTLLLSSLTCVDGVVEAVGVWLGARPEHWSVELVGDRTALRPDVQDDGTTVTLRFDTTWDPWGLGRTRVPVGRYWFSLNYGPEGRRRGRVLLDDALLDGIFDFTVDSEFRFRATRRAREAGVYLMPPLRDDERGPYAQEQLRRMLHDEWTLDESAVYLQSYNGNSATDSQLAIHHELRRTRPDLRLYWGIADRSSAVPEGGIPVVMHTREWYELMSRAAYLTLNIDFDRRYFRRPGQQVLQTFHGYPSKAMGVVLWETKQYTPRRIEAELGRTRDDWDLILTPSPEMDEHYRVQYRYEGRIHSQGYPRDDMLVGEGTARLREETRARLGIAAHQKAVLYAPTWRDDQATNYRSATMVTHLDVEEVSRALGPDYVVLMRGHRFHAGAAEQSRGNARLVDVTSYPEINHLILAADAAVLDYSSLRFDFSLTGNPMVFLVPDLATYAGGVRGFLFDFAESAPGPLLDTTAEVIAALRDLDALRREHAPAYAAFHERFNRYMDGHATERVVKAFFG